MQRRKGIHATPLYPLRGRVLMMMSPTPAETGTFALEDSQPGAGWLNVAFWHKADLQRPLGLGPITATLPTFGAECLVIAAFQTSRRGVAKVGT